MGGSGGGDSYGSGRVCIVSDYKLRRAVPCRYDARLGGREDKNMDLHILAGLQYVGENEDGEREYIGLAKEWEAYEKLQRDFDEGVIESALDIFENGRDEAREEAIRGQY